MSVANPLNPAGSLNQGCWKRKGSEEEDDKLDSRAKKPKYSWYVTLESESPQPTSSDEDDESIYSVQAHETEYVQDTSDTSANTWVTSGEDVVHVEYEVASLSENENPFIDCLTSSDPEDIISYGVIAAAICDSDVGLADNSDGSMTSRDSEISHADYWTCVQCNNSNNNPLFRYCEKCYRTRKHFFPPRPKGKRRRKTSKKRALQMQSMDGQKLTAMDSGFHSTLANQSTLLSDFKRTQFDKSSSCSGQIEKIPQTSFSYSQESVDTGFSSSPSQPSSILLSQPGSSLSQEKSSIVKNYEDETTEKINDNTEPKFGSQESQCSLATTVSINDKNLDLSDSSQDVDMVKKIKISSKRAKLPNKTDNKLCLICTVGPKNGIFVHGRDSHICCCFRCTMKVWKTTKHCPICNRKVTDVLKAHYA